MITRTRTAALFLLAQIVVAAAVVFGVLGGLAVTAAFAHDGPGAFHPVACDDIPDIPAGIQCFEPGTYNGDRPHDEIYHGFHPICEGVAPGQGSAAGRPYWYECLPETGSTSGALAIAGGAALAAGATTVILGGRRRMFLEDDE